APHLPPHEPDIERSRFLVVGASVGEVIEPNGLPAGCREWRHKRRCIPRSAAAARAGARLAERGGRYRDRRNADGLEQLATGNHPLVEFIVERRIISHEQNDRTFNLSAQVLSGYGFAIRGYCGEASPAKEKRHHDIIINVKRTLIQFDEETYEKLRRRAFEE